MFDAERRHLVAYVAAAAVLVVIAVRFTGRTAPPAPVPSVSVAAPARPRHVARPLIWIDVAGAVRRPGLYSLPAGSRVAAALERAGGTLARAETAAVNLAAKLADGQQVVVPMRGRSAPVVAGAAGAAARAALPSAKISLSSASQEQLEELDGIGPGLAGRIIEYRQAHGGFRSTEQLREVSGIGDKRFEALRSRIEP